LGAALWLSNWLNQSVASLLQHPVVRERVDAVAPEVRERLSEAICGRQTEPLQCFCACWHFWHPLTCWA
jgi:hypothetical protein